MTPQDILSALDSCESTIYRHDPGALPVRADIGSLRNSHTDKVSHALWMIQETRDFIHECRIEKAFRWLGFVQGVLWSIGLVSIDEAKEANRRRCNMARKSEAEQKVQDDSAWAKSWFQNMPEPWRTEYEKLKARRVSKVDGL